MTRYMFAWFISLLSEKSQLRVDPSIPRSAHQKKFWRPRAQTLFRKGTKKSKTTRTSYIFDVRVDCFFRKCDVPGFR
jgi:hypothetical protein